MNGAAIGGTYLPGESDKAPLDVDAAVPGQPITGRFAAGKISLDFSTGRGAVKPLHGVNNAPVRLSGRLDVQLLGGIGRAFVGRRASWSPRLNLPVVTRLRMNWPAGFEVGTP